MELLGDVSHVESRSVRLEMELVLMEDRCTVSQNVPQAQISVWTHTMEFLDDVVHVESRPVLWRWC